MIRHEEDFVENRNRRVAAFVLCLTIASHVVAAPWPTTPSLFERFLAYVQSRLSPPIPPAKRRLSPPIRTQSKLAPPLPVTPPSDTEATTELTTTKVAPPQP